MKKIIMLVFALLGFGAAFALSACGSNDQHHESTPHHSLYDLRGIALERRLNIQRPDYARLIELTAGREQQTIDIDVFFGQAPPMSSLTPQQAADDALLFFDALRQIYGLYIYFGGDEVFTPIFDGIIAEIFTRDALTPIQLRQIIAAPLNPIINDNHFRLSGISGPSATFHTSRTPFDRDGYGFRHRESGLLVAEIEGHDKQEVFRLSMDESGDVFYSLVVYSLEPSVPWTRTLNLIFEDGSEYAATLDRLAQNRRSHRSPSLSFVDDIPVVTIASLNAYTHHGGFNNQEAADFLSFARELRNEPAIILDIRGNSGGNGILAVQWLYELTGHIVPENHVWLSTFTYEELSREPVGAFTPPADYFRRYVGFAPFDETHSIMSFVNDTGNLIESNPLIIMLVDRYVASTGEGFVNKMFGMANTLAIGQNTAGIFLGDGVYTMAGMTLPNSGIEFGFGRGVIAHPQGHFAEGVGIAPDVWVHGDTLAAALVLLGSLN